MGQELASKKYNYVYQTKNMINERTYIGVHSTNNLNDGYLGSGDKLAFSIKKYGKENFKMEILDFFDTKAEAFQEESFLVNKEWVLDRNNYNMTLGGFAPPSGYGRKHSAETIEFLRRVNTGRVRSPETRKKISEAQIGRVVKPETLLKMSASMMGKNRMSPTRETIEKQMATKKLNPYIPTDEYRKKLSIAGKGRIKSEQERANLSKARKGKKLPEYWVNSLKKAHERQSNEDKIKRYSDRSYKIIAISSGNGLEIGRFHSASATSRELSVSLSRVLSSAKGHKIDGDYIFKFY